MSRDTEHQEQSLLFQWIALETPRHPELGLCFAVPNFAGFHGSQVARMRSGSRAKAEGRKKGVPDICLPVPRGAFHGLFIELKAKGGRPSPEQRQWLQALREQGYAAHLCVGWDDARQTITDYLALPSHAAA
ncbi:VRR-NUC domain-containing protein [Humibacter sp.]|uniref:VRR-NUC domain-containing protein n=1 Tax=Humibacter sp. TaxID=1940291 RepID=UPI003F7D202D